MHRALEIREIIDLVVSFLPHSALPALVRLRVFHNSAYTILWRSINEDVLATPQTGMTYERLHHYTQFVKEIVVRFPDPTEQSYTFLARFLSGLGTYPSLAQHLFPNLEKLTFVLSEKRHLNHLGFLLVQTVTSLSIDVRYHCSPSTTPSILEALLRTIPHVCPRLQELSFTMPMVTEMVSNHGTLPRTLVRLPLLRRFAGDIGSLDAQTLHALGSLPSLQTLEIFCMSPHDTPAQGMALPGLPERIRQVAWPALRALVLHNASTKAVKWIVPNLRAHISHLTLYFAYTGFSEASLLSSMRVIPTSFPRLEKLAMSFLNCGLLDATCHMLAPLHQCRSLRAFSFIWHSVFPFHIENSDMAIMASSWPGLEELFISRMLAPRPDEEEDGDSEDNDDDEQAESHPTQTAGIAGSDTVAGNEQSDHHQPAGEEDEDDMHPNDEQDEDDMQSDDEGYEDETGPDWRNPDDYNDKLSTRYEHLSVLNILGLASLAENCPNLRRVYLMPCFSNCEISLSGLPASTQYIELDVRGGFIDEEDVEMISHFLYTIWPNVTLNVDCDTEEETEMWNEVAETITKLRWTDRSSQL